MSGSPALSLQERLAELRASFDGSFARPAHAVEPTTQAAFLGIRAAEGRLVVRVAELAGVHACRKIVGLAGGPPGLLGLAGVRGRLVAVYRLTALLGYEASEERLRWLLLARGGQGIALAIEELDGHLRASPAELHPAHAGSGETEYVTEWLRQDGATRGVLNLPSIIAAIEQRAPARG